VPLLLVRGRWPRYFPNERFFPVQFLYYAMNSVMSSLNGTFIFSKKVGHRCPYPDHFSKYQLHTYSEDFISSGYFITANWTGENFFALNVLYV